MQYIRYLSRSDVDALGMSVSEIIETLRGAFLEKSRGNVQMPPKAAVHPGDADNFIHAMPAYIRGKAVGIKWVSGFPGNTVADLPYISGLVILNSADTGIPTAVMDCTWITAVRTAAASALSAQFLARPDSQVLGVLGCGTQARSHVAALKVVLPKIKAVRAFDIDLGIAGEFADRMKREHGVDAAAVATPREAVSACDVVVTAGPILHEPHATIRRGWVDPGTFVTAIDFDSYFHRDALSEFEKFTTDDVPQLMHFRKLGYFRHIPRIHAELGQLVAGASPGRVHATERTLACNLGVALADIAVAGLVLERAQAVDIGLILPL